MAFDPHTAGFDAGNHAMDKLGNIQLPGLF
jgi:hypothetical protein